MNSDSFLEFEKMIYTEKNMFSKLDIDDSDFIINHLVIYPSLRPLELDKIVHLSKMYCDDLCFRQKLLKKASKSCYIMVYRLFMDDIYTFNEVFHYLECENSIIFGCYFMNEFNDFSNYISSKTIPDDFDMDLLDRENDLKTIIQYGFMPSTIEFCLKYDDFFSFKDIVLDFSDLKSRELRWSLFEWSHIPTSLDALSFAGFFGSTRIFKYLLMNGFPINEIIMENIVCSGNFDLFHCCYDSMSDLSRLLINAVEFFQVPLLQFLLEYGADINYNSDDQGSPLHVASKKGFLTITQFLVDSGANLEIRKGSRVFCKNYGLQFIMLAGMDIS